MRRWPGSTPSRAERAAEDVVEAAVIRVRALERDDVDRLLDDADRGVVAACVEADRACLFLGQVPALAAEADALLHLVERGGERGCLLRRALEDVEREPLRGALADPGQACQLRDEVLDGGAEHRAIVPATVGRSVRFGHVLGGTVPGTRPEKTPPAATPLGQCGSERERAAKDMSRGLSPGDTAC